MIIDKPNSDVENEEKAKEIAQAEIAKNLGINLDDNSNGTEEKKSDSSKKMDTETTKENSSGELDKSSKEGGDVDYKKKYSESTKEFQEKYKPMEDKIKNLEQLSGKGLDDILRDYTKSSEEQIESQRKANEKKDSPTNDEVKEKLSSVEKKLGSLEEKVLEQDERNKLSVKVKVQEFQKSHGVSEDEYYKKYQPLLSGIKDMRKENGDPYTLDEALDVAYLIGNKHILDQVVERKLKVRLSEQDMSFSPGGSRQTPSEKPKYSQAQEEAARRFGVNLGEEKKSS